MVVPVDVLGVEALELEPVDPGVAGPATERVETVDWSRDVEAETGRMDAVAGACDERSV